MQLFTCKVVYIHSLITAFFVLMFLLCERFVFFCTICGVVSSPASGVGVVVGGGGGG